MVINKTDDLLKKIDEVYNANISENVTIRLKQLILDYICVTQAGAKYNKNKIKKWIAFSGIEDGNFSVIGTGLKTTLKDAVFLNGLNAHTLDYDDGTNAGIIHLGAPIFSVLIPLAQKYKFSNDRFMRAVVAGYETSFTMAYSIQPGHKERGYHATGTCGILGATIAISYALDFTDQEKKNAFGAACVAASGMLLALDGGSELKPYNVAKTALLAFTSAQMAKAGFRSHDDPLGTERGYLYMMTGKPNIEIVSTRYNDTYAIEKTYTKPYAACRYCHPAIECAINIKKDMNNDNITIDEIEDIEAITYSIAVGGHDHKKIVNVASAKMSIPYGVAVALTKGKAGLMEYQDDVINNKNINRLLKYIVVKSDSEMSRLFPEEQRAIVNVRTKLKVYSHFVKYPKGEPQNPLSENEFKLRFDEMCAYAGEKNDRMSKIYEAIKDKNKNLYETFNML